MVLVNDMSKINISIIIMKHFRTLYNNRTKRLSHADIIIFYIIPCIIAVAVVAYYNKYIHILYNSILLFSSIFIPMFFSSLVFIYGILQRQRDKLTQELAFNISYLILINILLLIITLVSILCYAIAPGAIVLIVINIFIMLVLAHTIATILLVIKRLHIILAELPNKSETTD